LIQPCRHKNFEVTCSSVEMQKGTWSEKGWEPLFYADLLLEA